MTTKTEYEIVEIYAVTGYNESGYHGHTMDYFSSIEEANELALSLDHKASYKYYGHSIPSRLKVDKRNALKVNDKYFLLDAKDPVTVK